MPQLRLGADGAEQESGDQSRDADGLGGGHDGTCPHSKLGAAGDVSASMTATTSPASGASTTCVAYSSRTLRAAEQSAAVRKRSAHTEMVRKRPAQHPVVVRETS